MLYCYSLLPFEKLQAAESKLSKFVEDIIVPPRMIDIIVDGEVITYILSTNYIIIFLYTISIYFTIILSLLYELSSYLFATSNM
jgi:hypothetical protein